MPLAPELAADILAACRQNAGDIASAIGRTFGGTCILGESKSASYETAPAEWNRPGLIFVFKTDDSAALLIFSEASGLVPAWSASPDATQTSKLATLAQELGMSMLPEAHMPSEFKFARVEKVAQTVSSSGVPSGAGLATLSLELDGKKADITLLWPASTALAALEKPVADPAIETSVSAKPASNPAAISPAPAAPLDFETAVDRLPSYVRSLLKIRVPVSVTLATTRQPVSRVLNIGPGSIIQFSKNCEQPLCLSVGGEPIAEGDAVKIGEKFGLRITAMILPGERFFALRGRKAG